MRKLSLFIIICLAVPSFSLAQQCFPNGITFSSQSSIDNFQDNFPDCTEIEGDLVIKRTTQGSDPITNLDGLSAISTVAGSLKLQGAASNYPLLLTNMQGLENTTSIGGDLWVYSSTIESFEGLEGLISVGGNLYISFNDSLTSLSGLDNLETINGDVRIGFNENLSNCEVQGICNYLSNPAGSVDIYNNATGCNNPPEIATDCGIVLQCLPFGNYYLFSQSEVDNFQTDYGNCTEISGNMEVNGLDVSNLEGLSILTSVEGRLSIGNSDFGNPLLTSLAGLENVQTVGGDLVIWSNANLADISGIANISSLGGNLEIGRSDVLTNLNGLINYTSIGGHLSISINSSLTSIAGLLNLTSIGEGASISIQSNDILTNLFGIDNIDAESIDALTISNNPQLSNCEVQSICDYLTSQDGSYYIHDNAEGCNSREEILEACETAGIQDIIHEPEILIFPNPATKEIFISTENDIILNEIIIYNQLGQKIIHRNCLTNVLDVSMLQKGVYILELGSGGLRIKKKLIIR